MLKKTMSGVVFISILLVSCSASAKNASSEGGWHGEAVFFAVNEPVNLIITSRGPFKAGPMHAWVSLADIKVQASTDEYAVIRFTEGHGGATSGIGRRVIYGKNPKNELSVSINCDDNSCAGTGTADDPSPWFGSHRNGSWTGLMYKTDMEDVAADIYTVYMDVGVWNQ